MTVLHYLLLTIVGISTCRGETLQKGSVYCEDKKCTYYANQIDENGATAYGSFNDTLLETGWGILDIVAGYGKEKPKNNDIMYAAGYLEGIITASRIAQHYQNAGRIFFGGKESPDIETKMRKYFKEQDGWMRNMIEKHSPTDPIWRHVGYLISQYDGLIQGYSTARVTQESLPELEVYAFQLLNGGGDIIDLIKMIDPDSVPDWRQMTKMEAMRYLNTGGHCSVLIKALGAFENLLMSHSTWFPYAATMRIYKHWNFNVNDEATSAKQISFSGYPGLLESLDDFYLLGSKMVMLQTTNNIFNLTLYNANSPESLLSWHRVRVANMMANSGKEWAHVVAQYNSGTYNNQYMIIDLKQIELNKDIKDNTLWVIEQIPSLVKAGDQTNILRAGYWASYNVPFYEEIYNMSGYPEFAGKHGVDSTYQLAQRAKIFRRDVGKVVDMESFKHIMRYNDYKKDNYSENNPCNTICCRGDLDEKSPRADGCYDTKLTDINMALTFQAEIISGPTLDNGLPPFKWQPPFNQSHVGLPSVYNFPFITTQPRWSNQSIQ